VDFIDPSELDAHVRAVAAGFHDEVSDERMARIHRLAYPDRAIAARDGATTVGTTSSHPFRLTVPGADVAAAGITAVTVQPTHRRRGLLRQMMRLQLDNLHERGELAAVLWASEGAIYPRFGYGLATLNGRLDADRSRMALRDPEPQGQVRLVSTEEALETLPAIYERERRQRPGFYSRSSSWWEFRTRADDAWDRRGAGPIVRAVLELGGDDAGYALYRFRHVWTRGIPEGEVHVQEALATSPVAYRELWRFLFGVDLVARVQARHLAIDDPLPLLVTEPTPLGLSTGDGLYLRLVDVGAALAARCYAGDGQITLDVADDFCPWNAGVWRLEVSGDLAQVERVDGRADLRVGVGDLASVYLGGFTFAQLERALRVDEITQGAIPRADALFRSERAPWCPESF